MFDELADACSAFACVQMLLFQSGLFYGSPIGLAAFKARYPNGCPGR